MKFVDDDDDDDDDPLHSPSLFQFVQIRDSKPDDYFQTRVSGLDALKPGLRVWVRVCNFEE